MIKHTFLFTVIACFAAATAVVAENAIEREKRFHDLDKDNDKHISLYEARDKHRVFYYYQSADKNEDGHLDMTEFSAFEDAVPDYEAK